MTLIDNGYIKELWDVAFKEYIITAGVNTAQKLGISNKLADYLLNKGANVDAKIGMRIREREAQCALLHIATMANRSDLIQTLLQHGANINEKSIWKKREDGSGPYISYEETPLSLSLEYSHSGITKMLLENGAKIQKFQHGTEIVDSQDFLQYHMSNTYGLTPEALELLIQYGATISQDYFNSIKDNFGNQRVRYLLQNNIQ